MSKNVLQAGFARANVNPPMGINIAGYYKVRLADGVLDDLEINGVALKAGEQTVLFLSIDHCGLKMNYVDLFKKAVTERTGIPAEAIFMSATHTHTGPAFGLGNPLEDAYIELVKTRFADVAQFAIDDLKPAKMGQGQGLAPNISFVRRFRMKDGSAKTNPGVNNPDIVAPIGDVDERVVVLRFDRENADSIVLVHFADHPDVVGGCKISGDWPALTRKFVEKSIDNTKCIFFNGAQGDVNHVNVHPKPGDFNDMFNDFDGCSRGYGHARHMARVVTGAVLQVYDKVEYVDVDSIKYSLNIVDIPANKATKEELVLAHKYNDLHNAGKDDEIPYKAMMLTTVVAEAARMVRLENAPDYFKLPFAAISIGNVAFFGIPGEPFTGVGRGLKEAEGWDYVLPCCLTNGSEGYYPMKDSYDEGGYEARSSGFKAGTAEKIIDEGLKILSDLRK